MTKLWKLLYWPIVTPILIVRSRKLSPFDYKELCRLQFVVNPFYLGENSFYGHAHAIRRAGFRVWGARIEHAVFFSDSGVRNAVVTSWAKRFFYRLKTIYTYGEERKGCIERCLCENNLKMRVVAVGPYIRYAQEFYTEKEHACLKKKMGRILLVFPQHSVEGVSVRYSFEDMIARIRDVGRDYDTVLISMYWKDILDGKAAVYEKAGFIVVSSGRREDPYFMSRQKSLIRLADRIMTNSVGTYIGYAISMGRPCYFYNGESSFSADSRTEAVNFTELSDMKSEFAGRFSDPRAPITSNQLSFIQRYWGNW